MGRRSWAAGRVLLSQLGLLVAFTVALGALASAPQDRTRLKLERGAVAVAEVIQETLDETFARLDVVSSFFGDEETPDWRGFGRLLQASRERARLEDQAVIAWAPRVPRWERAEYEAQTGREGYRSFGVRDGDGRGNVRVAASRRDYFPVHFVDHVAELDGLLGVDLGARPGVRAALLRAERSGAPQVIAPFFFGVGVQEEPQVLLLRPVFGPPLASAPGGPRSLRGVIVAAVPARTVAALAVPMTMVSAAGSLSASLPGSSPILRIRPAGEPEVPEPEGLPNALVGRATISLGGSLFAVELLVPGPARALARLRR